MNRHLRTLTTSAACGLTATVLAAAASLLFHGTTAVVAWVAVACAAAVAGGIYAGLRSSQEDKDR